MPKCVLCSEDPCRCTAAATRIDDGGPAFPESYTGADRPHDGIGGGMSLRDWFAGQALAGILASETPLHDGEPYDVTAPGAIAYQIADAIIAERAKGR